MIGSDQPLIRVSFAGASSRLVVKLLSLDRESWKDGVFPQIPIAMFGNFLMSVSLLFRPTNVPVFVIAVTAIFIGIAPAFARFDLVHRTHPSSLTKAS